MEDYLLDTNAYFAILRYVISQERNEKYERILNGNCCISKLTRIEIISVIGKYARGAEDLFRSVIVYRKEKSSLVGKNMWLGRKENGARKNYGIG